MIFSRPLRALLPHLITQRYWSERAESIFREHPARRSDCTTRRPTVSRIYIPYLLMGSKDGSAILCDCGTLGLWDSQTSTWAFSANQGNGTVNGAISGDGNILVQGDYILNPQLLITGQLAHWDFLRGPLGLSGASDILNSSGSIDYK